MYLYFNRSIDPFVMSYTNSCFSYLQAPGFHIIGNIFGIDGSKLPGMEINKSHGLYYVQKSIMDEPSIAKFILKRINVFAEQRGKMSKKQMDLIKNNINK